MPAARTDLTSWDPRTTYSVSIQVPKVGMKTRTFMDGIVIEDIMLNMTKAYLYALALTKRYDRAETPKAVRHDLTRSRLIF